MVPEQFKYVVFKHNKLTFPGNLFHHRNKVDLDEEMLGRDEGRLQHKCFSIK
jgi:hypothetical protein